MYSTLGYSKVYVNFMQVLAKLDGKAHCFSSTNSREGARIPLQVQQGFIRSARTTVMQLIKPSVARI